MKTIRLNLETVAAYPRVATVGFFDGVHAGHRYLVQQVIAEARATGMTATVITFARHPRQVLRQDYVPQLLDTLSSKLNHLADTQVDECVLLDFNTEMASLSAYDFMRQILRDRLQVQTLVIGYDNRFGHNRSEGFDDYVRYGNEIGIKVIRNDALILDGIKVSSSVVRGFIAQGEIALANRCLGYPYTIEGTVVTGYSEGHKMGYPTANLDIASLTQMLPQQGVYATLWSMEGDPLWHEAMTNVGTRPTFPDRGVSVETHIFDFDGDVYGAHMQLKFCARIRAERRFEDAAALRAQLREDEYEARTFFKQYKG